ncbi:hypothetical protein J3E69DRAFT_334704, partial [Trichoderma sp. SZMC 28015]
MPPSPKNAATLAQECVSRPRPWRLLPFLSLSFLGAFTPCAPSCSTHGSSVSRSAPCKDARCLCNCSSRLAICLRLRGDGERGEKNSTETRRCGTDAPS